MYLIEIDIETGLISEEPSNSGWKAISAFRNLYEKKGIKAITVVALSCDYLSMIHYYNEKERPVRAVEEVYGKRNALKMDNPLVVAAVDKYIELQFNPDLEQERINQEIKMRLLTKISAANREEDDVEIEKLRKALNNHEGTIEKFNNRYNKKEAIKSSATNNGYSLSRIENDIKARKNSKFVNHGEGHENPNKLGLETDGPFKN